MIPTILFRVLMLTSAASAFADPPAPPAAAPAACLASGDGYLRAHLAGAINANVDWPNSGTQCEGESRAKPPGVRLSFQRTAGGAPDLLLVFGLTGVRAGGSASAAAGAVAYRVEARGFCTQPAHAIRGNGDVLVSTFEFAGFVIYQSQDTATGELPP